MSLNFSPLNTCFIKCLGRVSTDEEISTEDDEDDDSLDEDATPDGFIDTCNTQHLRSGSLDMMAVYR